MNVLKSIKYSGKGLMSGQITEFEIKPGPINSGINFVNAQTGEVLPATTDHILDTTHMVVLGTPHFNVRLAEHLMAALAFTSTTDIEIHITGNEIPAADGSAIDFYNLLKEHYSTTTNNDILFSLPETISFQHEHTSIIAIPAESLRITYNVNYPGSPFAKKWYCWEKGKNSPEDIISARTFGYTKDLPLYQSQGFALGVTKDNTIGFNEDGSFTTELRMPDEPIRHKVLDIIGDLYLSGINPLSIKAHIIAIECGHFQHIELARRIKSAILTQEEK
jgi:UDP-3-O-acyl-N-acetylglucosamine deacetylase